MANENKKINELVDADSDSTSELEALTVRLFQEEKPGTRILESEENTFDFSEIDNTASNSGSLSELQVELQQSASIIERLQYDHQQLHSRYLGLQAEVATRQQLNDKLSNSLSKADKELGEVHSLLADREQLVQELQSQIRDRDLELHNLTRLTHELKSAKSELESGDEISKARKKLVEYEGANASLNATLSGLRNQQQQTEQYAVELRRQLADLRTESQSAVSERAELRVELSNAESKIAALEGRLVKSCATLDIAEG
jgi:chromosome segregation ATPase